MPESERASRAASKALETLSAEIWMKARLWLALAEIQDREAALRDIDFAALVKRAHGSSRHSHHTTGMRRGES